MSRSKKKFPVSQWACGCDNPWHILDNRRFRRACKQWTYLVRIGALNPDSVVFPVRREYSNPYNWPSDGGRYYEAFHRCTEICRLDGFEERWCAWSRKWDAKRMRK